MTARPKKTLPLEVVLSDLSYDLLDQAAALRGQRVAEFVIDAAREAAERVIAQQEVIHLTPEDQILFAEGLINPPRVAEALKRAFIAHRDLLDPS